MRTVFVPLVQLVEPSAHNRVVQGSRPWWNTINGSVAQRQSANLLSWMSRYRNSPGPPYLIYHVVYKTKIEVILLFSFAYLPRVGKVETDLNAAVV